MKSKPKILVILGQTATGKSDLAVFLARKLNGEIISADSRQVYKNLNLGTGKITKKEMKGVPHYMLDIVNPRQVFTVAEYQKLTNEKIREIIGRKKLPIICGGTGFYIDAVTKGLILPEVPPNQKLREHLETKSAEVLFKILQKLDKTRAKNIDKNNKVRLVRAIEIAKFLGKVPKVQKNKPEFNFIKIGLTLPDEVLRNKISQRLEKRIRLGMLNEVKNLHKKGLSWIRMHELGLEYRYMAMYLEKKITKQEMLEKLNTEIYRYAKRQMTWFKRDTEIKWFQPPNNKKIESYLNSLIRKE